MDRSLDLILRLFCLGQLFTCIRPYLLEGLARSFEAEGWSGLWSGVAEAWPLARWLVYGMCLAIVVAGARRPLFQGLAIAQLIDVAAAIGMNRLESGYSEKGLLALVSIGVAGLLTFDRGQEVERAARMRSLLRGAASIAFAAIAFNKINSDFLGAATSCAKVLNQGLVRSVPFAEPLTSFLSEHVWGALLMEVLLLPLLLAVPRFGVIYVWGFFVSVAMVGPRATCFVFMALGLIFLPPRDFDRLRAGSRPVYCGAVASLLVSLLFWMLALDAPRRFEVTQLLGRVGFLSIALLGIALLVANLWLARKDEADEADEIEAPAAGLATLRAGSLAVRCVVGAVLALLLLNESSPYLGLKTKYSLTMWSNLRTDAGRWNSYLVPESLPRSKRVDRALMQVTEIRRVRPGRGRRGSVIPPFVAAHESTLAHLRRLEKRFGELTFRVTLDERTRDFRGTGPDSEFSRFIESTRPRVDWFEDAVMSLGLPQRCLGP